MKSLNLEKYYIGELYILNKTLDLLPNRKGAIELKNDNLEINGYLSIFSKNNSTTYTCLHNKKKYSIDGDNYIKNPIPFEEFLPKVSFKKPEFLTPHQAINIYNQLFHNEWPYNIKMYNKDTIKLNNLYVGNLNLCTQKQLNDEDEFEYLNLAQKHLLYKSRATIINNIQKEIYKYKTFKCLVLKLDNKLLNLHNHQIYPLKNNSDNQINLGESYYESITPYVESVNPKYLKNLSEDVTPEKALRIYKLK